MELAEAIRRLIPLQLKIPNPRKPLELKAHCVADAFLVETGCGPAVAWVEAFWCKSETDRVAHIAYAQPHQYDEEDRWVDHDPSYGPYCLAYLRPFLIERITKDSITWRDHKAWQHWRASQGIVCGRRAAWERIEREFGALIQERLT